MIKYAFLSCITAFLGICSLKAQTIGQPADKVQFILKSYAYNYPGKYEYHDGYDDGKLVFCSIYESEVYSVVHDKMIATNKVYVFKGDTLSVVVIEYRKNISKAELEEEYEKLYLKIGYLYFSQDLNYHFEIKQHDSNKFPIAVYKLVDKNKLTKEVKDIYETKLHNRVNTK